MEWCDEDGLAPAALCFLRQTPDTWMCAVHPTRPAYRKKHMLCQSCYRAYRAAAAPVHHDGDCPSNKKPCGVCGKLTRASRRGCCPACYRTHPLRNARVGVAAYKAPSSSQLGPASFQNGLIEPVATCTRSECTKT